jgi:ribosomal protein S18 acetylase RimI-like enzyme
MARRAKGAVRPPPGCPSQEAWSQLPPPTTPSSAAGDAVPPAAGPIPAGARDRFVPAEGSLLLPAVGCLVGGGPDADPAVARRFIAATSRQGIDIHRMWTECDAGGRPIRAVLVVPNPGRTAVFFAGPAAGPADAVGLAGLIDHVAGRLDASEIHLAQALVDPGDTALAAALLGGGFHRLADLGYLERSIPARPLPTAAWPDGVRTTPWHESRREEVIEVLLASYEDTLDCPGLRGLRDPEDVFEGHRLAGAFEPALWRILECDGRAAGVIMLNPSPGSGTIELIYLGLAAAARGRGLGRRLLVDSLNALRGRPEPTVSLAVDLANTPALGLYRGLGFRSRCRRIAFIRSLRTPPADAIDPG